MFQKAISFAAAAHAGQCRKGTDIPYIVHPIEVMKIVCGLTADEEVRTAAVLHDTLEDTETTAEQLRELFGERVTGLVGAESENKREELPAESTWKIRKEETVHDIAEALPETKMICLGDKLANMQDIASDFHELHDRLWERFNAPEEAVFAELGNVSGLKAKKINIAWYYRSIAEALRPDLEETAAFRRFDLLIKQVFESGSEEK